MEANKVTDMRILRRLYGSEGCEWMKGATDRSCLLPAGVGWGPALRATYGFWPWGPGEPSLLFRHTRNACILSQTGQQTLVGARSLMNWILDANQIFKLMFSLSGRTIPTGPVDLFLHKTQASLNMHSFFLNMPEAGRWLHLKTRGYRSGPREGEEVTSASPLGWKATC